MTIQQCRIYYFQFVVLSHKRNTQCFKQIKQSLLSGQTFKSLSDKQSKINCFSNSNFKEYLNRHTLSLMLLLSGVDMLPHIYEQLHDTFDWSLIHAGGYLFEKQRHCFEYCINSSVLSLQKFPGYREEKKRCEYLHQKLSYIKQLISDFDVSQASS